MLYTVDATHRCEVVDMDWSTQRLNLDVDKLVGMYQRGVSVKAMAEHFGCSRNVVVRRLDKLGLPVRSRSEAMKIRQSRMTQEERMALLEKAHAAARGRVHSEEECVKRAETRFAKQLGASAYQLEVKTALTARGLDFVMEFPVGKYNLDLSCHALSIAVELHGGGWHRYGRHWARRQDRLENVLGAGWNLIEVWMVGGPGWDSERVADQVVAISQGIGPDPAPGCKHWMLSCNGEPARELRSYGHDVPSIHGADRRDDGTGRYGRIT